MASKKTRILNGVAIALNAMLERRYLNQNIFISVAFDFDEETKEHFMQVIVDKEGDNFGYLNVMFTTQDVGYLSHKAGELFGMVETYMMLSLIRKNPALKAMTLVV